MENLESRRIKSLRVNKLEVAKYPGAVPVQMLQPGAMPMSAPQMPPPGNFMSAPNQMLFMGGGYGQVGYMSGDVLPKNQIVRFSRKTAIA